MVMMFEMTGSWSLNQGVNLLVNEWCSTILVKGCLIMLLKVKIVLMKQSSVRHALKKGCELAKFCGKIFLNSP